MNRTAFAALAAALAASAAPAADMTKAARDAARAAIESEYKAARADCEASKDNARDICVAGAKGHERVSLAELEAAYAPSDRTRHELRLAKAQAAYAVAIERCDEQSGPTKDLCVKEAGAALGVASAPVKATREAGGPRP